VSLQTLDVTDQFRAFGSKLSVADSIDKSAAETKPAEATTARQTNAVRRRIERAVRGMEAPDRGEQWRRPAAVARFHCDVNPGKLASHIALPG